MNTPKTHNEEYQHTSLGVFVMLQKQKGQRRSSHSDHCKMEAITQFRLLGAIQACTEEIIDLMEAHCHLKRKMEEEGEATHISRAMEIVRHSLRRKTRQPRAMKAQASRVLPLLQPPKWWRSSWSPFLGPFLKKTGPFQGQHPLRMILSILSYISSMSLGCFSFNKVYWPRITK